MTMMRPSGIRKSIVLLLSLAVLASGCSFTKAARKQKFFDSGRKYFENKDYVDAALQLQNAVKLDPNWPEAQYQLGLTFVKLKDGRRALSAFTRAVELRPNYFEANLELARVETDAHQWDNALKHAQKAMDLKPENADAKEAIAYVYGGMGKPEEEERELEAVITQEPSASRATLNLARLKFRRQDAAGAEQVLTQATQKAPTADNFLNLGNFYMVTSRQQDAENAYRKAAQANPHATEPQYALAHLFIEGNRVAEAESVFRTLAQQHPDEPEQRAAPARFYLQEGDLGKAESELQAIIARYPKDRYATNVLAAALIQDNKPDQARALISDVIRKNPKDTEALLLRGMMATVTKQPDMAITDLQEVLHLRPESSLAHYYLALAHEQRHEHGIFMQELEEALKRNPRNLAARIALVKAHLDARDFRVVLDILHATPPPQNTYVPVRLAWAAALGGTNDLPEAEKELRGLIAERPNLGEAHARLGLVLADEKNMKEAQSELERALALAPDDEVAAKGLARIYVMQKQAVAGEASFSKMAAAHPRSASLVMAQATLQFQIGKTDAAVATLKGFLANQPQVEPVKLLLGQLLNIRADSANAEQVYREILKTDPNRVEALLGLSMALHRQKRTQEAIAAYREVLKRQPEEPLAANNLASLLVENGGNLDEALKLAETAKEKAPNNPAVADTLGWIYYKMGRYNLAEDQLGQAVAAEPSQPTYEYHFGMTELLNGNREKGRKALQVAVSSNQDFPGAQEARTTLKSLLGTH